MCLSRVLFAHAREPNNINGRSTGYFRSRTEVQEGIMQCGEWGLTRIRVVET